MVVVGHPEYYPRFGFEPAHTRGLTLRDFDVPQDVFMVVELAAGVRERLKGAVRYPKRVRGGVNEGEHRSELQGDCEAAFKFYEQHLGGQPGPIFRYAGSPMADSVPPDWRDKIMHGSIVVGDLVLMGGDFLEGQYEHPRASRCHCR